MENEGFEVVESEKKGSNVTLMVVVATAAVVAVIACAALAWASDGKVRTIPKDISFTT